MLQTWIVVPLTSSALKPLPTQKASVWWGREAEGTVGEAASPPAYMDQPEFQKFVDDDAKRLIPVIRKIGRLDEK